MKKAAMNAGNATYIHVISHIQTVQRMGENLLVWVVITDAKDALRQTP
jgi:hypothetical protein